MPYLAIYARLIIERHTITLRDDTVYLCGPPSPTHEQAEGVARACVNAASGENKWYMLPRVFEIEEGETLWDTMCRAQDFFERIVRSMNEVDAMVARVGHW
jgi:hypothetical protein